MNIQQGVNGLWIINKTLTSRRVSLQVCKVKKLSHWLSKCAKCNRSLISLSRVEIGFTKSVIGWGTVQKCKYIAYRLSEQKYNEITTITLYTHLSTYTIITYFQYTDTAGLYYYWFWFGWCNSQLASSCATCSITSTNITFTVSPFNMQYLQYYNFTVQVAVVVP